MVTFPLGLAPLTSVRAAPSKLYARMTAYAYPRAGTAAVNPAQGQVGTRASDRAGLPN
jgi:hypothetical protein